MRQKLITYLEKLNRDLDSLEKDLRTYTHTQLNRTPAPGQWSALQALHHLRLSEKFSLHYCRKKLSHQPRLPKAGLRSAFRSFILNTYLASPFKFKAPRYINTSALPQEDSLDRLFDEWRQERTEWHRFLQELPEDYLHRTVYRHPFLGRISLLAMLRFFRAHWLRHRKQAYRALKNGTSATH